MITANLFYWVVVRAFDAPRLGVLGVALWSVMFLAATVWHGSYGALIIFLWLLTQLRALIKAATPEAQP